MTHKHRMSALSFALFLFLSSHTSAQGLLDDYQRAEKFLPGNLMRQIQLADVTPHWIERSNRFWYRREAAKGSEFVLVDAERNATGPAFDHPRLAESLSHAAKQSYVPSELPFADFEFVDSGKGIRFSIAKTQWTCQLENYNCLRIEVESNLYETLSPNGRWAAYVHEHNLYVRDVATGTVLQLTNDGGKDLNYATPMPALGLMVEQRTEEPRQPAAVFWSPDSSKFITYRVDSRNAGRFTSIQFVPSDQMRPRAFNYVYPLPGELLPKAEPVIFDILSGERVNVKTSALELPAEEGGPGFDWFPDSKHVFYDYDERGNKAKELRIVDAGTGEQRVVIHEESKTYVDPGETFYKFDNTGGEVLWSSERDGWNHLYLYTQGGKFENQVTQGPWVVQSIVYVDEKSRRVYFIANGREKNEDPYQTHLYVAGFDGKNLQLLTPENANHSVSFSPDGSFFVDRYSRPDLPDTSVLRRAKDGSTLRVLEQASVDELLKTGWKFPESFAGKASDGSTDLYGLIWRPSNFDASKKYPIVEFVYTGPQSFFVPKTFGHALWLQHMAELGFIVVMVDGRGTTGRSRAFHEYSYRNLGGAFEDHVAMIKQMAARYPYMDLDRVGIFGTSAGGYGAAHAMLVFPEFYKVGVSTSGDHDARLDKAWWNELYQGYPMEADYVAQSNVTMAPRLQGYLLIEHGDIDDNVHPVGTMRLVDALMKANRNFDMLFVPNMSHGESGEHRFYLMRRRWDYFVQHLLGVTPPANYEIHEGPRPPRR